MDKIEIYLHTVMHSRLVGLNIVKKTLIILAVLAMLLIVVDIVIRALDETEESVQIRPEAENSDETPPVKKMVVLGTKKLIEVEGGKTVKREAILQTSNLTIEECLAIGKKLIEKSPAKWMKGDYKIILEDPEFGTIADDLLYEYGICEAVNTADFTLCNTVDPIYHNLVKRGKKLENCIETYKKTLTVKAIYFDKVSFADFKMAIATNPPEVSEWMVDFFNVLDLGDMERCSDFSKEVEFFCRAAIKGKLPPIEECPFPKEDYFMYKSFLSGGAEEDMANLKQFWFSILLQMMKGDKEICSKAFKGYWEMMCERMPLPQ